MRVDRELVLQIARLAHIQLTEAEIELFTPQLAGILQYMEKLNEATEEAEPFVFGDFLQLPLRKDLTIPSFPVEKAMQNAPDQKKNLFRVPRVIP